MKFFFSDLFEKKQKGHHDQQTVTAFNQSLHNITEGSEFLDDAIRVQEQPFLHSYTEESVAPGSPKGMW